MDDWETYDSNDNRLLKYEVHEILTTDLIETVWYTYAVAEGYTGDVRQIIRHREDESDLYRRTWFNYDGAGRVWMVMNDTYEWDGDPENAPTNIQKLSALEFRYHSGRARYLMRDRNPDGLGLLGGPHDGVWTDYDGDTVYVDYRLELNESVLTPERHADHMPGSYVTTTQPAVYPATQPTESTEWYHTDQVGTTRAMTSEINGTIGAPEVSRRAMYTAFGELVTESGSAGTRYGYCGAWGYESGGGDSPGSLWGDSFDPTPGLVHVGARWYEQATGRFIQRDPIGIRGGLNVFAYLRSSPLNDVDPQGLDRYRVSDSDDFGAHEGLAVDDGRGGYIRIDFSAEAWTNNGKGATWKAFFGDKGVVQIRHYSTKSGALGCTYTRIPSTPEEDAKLVSWMLDQFLNPPGYAIIGGHTCISLAATGSLVGIPFKSTYQDKIYHFP